MCGQHGGLNLPYQVQRLNRLHLGCPPTRNRIVSTCATSTTLQSDHGNSIVEMTAGIIVCCMPSAAAIFHRIKPPVVSFFFYKHCGGPSSSRTIMKRNPANQRYMALRPLYENHEDVDSTDSQVGFLTTKRMMNTRQVHQVQWRQEARSIYPLRDLPQI